jgi:hypothetical protein
LVISMSQTSKVNSAKLERSIDTFGP